MADETTENQETPDEQAPEAVVETPTAEPVAEPVEPVADDAVVAEEPAEVVAAEPVAEKPAAPTEPVEPEEQLTSKERRRRTRSTHSGAAASQRSPEERKDERQGERRAKATARSRRRGQERDKHAKTPAGEGTPRAEHEPGTPQTRQGIVTSAKADKTLTVRIDSAKRHRRYQKIVRSTKSLHAHDESNDAREGDVVRVVECRPMSRSKRWRLVEILERAK